MKTVQMTLDDDLVNAVDKVARQQKTSRSEFTRRALREALQRVKIRHFEEAHKKGYLKQPVSFDEFSVWEDEQEWGGS